MKFHDLTDWLRNGLLPTVVLVLGALLVARFVQWATRRYLEVLDEQARATIEAGRTVSESTKRSRAIAQAVQWTLVSLTYFLAVILAVRQLGVPLPTLVAPATVVGVALGFGAQQVVGDLLAGFFLFSERQFGIGDLIRLSLPGQTTGVTGTVEELTLRVTKLRTGSGEFVVVPNSALRQVTNLSKDWSRGRARHPHPGHRGSGRGHRGSGRCGQVHGRRRGVVGHAARGAGDERCGDHRGRLRAAPTGGAHVAGSPVRREPREPRYRCSAALREAGILTAPLADQSAGAP